MFKKLNQTSFFIYIFFLFFTIPNLANAKDVTQPIPPARLAIRALSELDKGSLKTCPETFPYFPQSGPQQVGCYLLSLPSVKSFINLLPMPIFLKGPHRINEGHVSLEIDHTVDFGHYNPNFLTWVRARVLPALIHPNVVKANQKKFDETLKPFMSTLYLTLKKIKQSGECFKREVKAYQQYIASLQSGKVSPAEYSDLTGDRYFFFMNPRFCSNPAGGFEYFYGNGFSGDFDGNVVKGCVSWWMRRTIDGTAPLFEEILSQIVTYYIPYLLESTPSTPSEVMPEVNQDEELAIETLSAFKAALKVKDTNALTLLMDPTYFKSQHDKLLSGDTERFLNEFFCGPVLGTQKFQCLNFRALQSLSLTSLIRHTQKGWSVVYHFTASTSEAPQAPITILLSFELVERKSELGNRVYRIVGAVG